MRPVGGVPRLLRAGVAAAVFVLLDPAARASNAKPRIPPSFPDAGCLVEVDRSQDPVLRLSYGLALEDPQGMPPLLPDNRTHQFFLFCRDLLPDRDPPPWIDWDDVTRADAADVLDLWPPAADVLEEVGFGPGHDGAADSCAVPLLPKEARRPIQCEQAQVPVTFDTSGLVAGGYVLWGYTFEPDINLWTRRIGVVWIHDGDGAAPPVAALATPWADGTRAYPGSPFPLRGCAAGAAGTTVRVARAKVQEAADPSAYLEVATFEVEGASCGLTVDFTPQVEDAGLAWVFRIEAEDPSGRRFTGYAPGKLLVIPGDGTSDDGAPPIRLDVCGVEAESPEPLDACGLAPSPGTTGTGGGETTGGSSGGAAPAAGKRAAGCACTVISGPGNGPGLPPVLCLPLFLIRSRRCPSCAGSRSRSFRSFRSFRSS